MFIKDSQRKKERENGLQRLRCSRAITFIHFAGFLVCCASCTSQSIQFNSCRGVLHMALSLVFNHTHKCFFFLLHQSHQLFFFYICLFIQKCTTEQKFVKSTVRKNKAGYTATEVACGWARAIFEVT